MDSWLEAAHRRLTVNFFSVSLETVKIVRKWDVNVSRKTSGLLSNLFQEKFSKIHELVIITEPGAQMACRIFYLWSSLDLFNFWSRWLLFWSSCSLHSWHAFLTPLVRSMRAQTISYKTDSVCSNTLAAHLCDLVGYAARAACWRYVWKHDEIMFLKNLNLFIFIKI